MPLSLDPQLAAAAGDALAGVRMGASQAHLVPLETRRKQSSDLIKGALATLGRFDDIVETVHDLELRDGATIKLLELTKRGTEGEAKGEARGHGQGRPAILQLHGGGFVTLDAFDTKAAIMPIVEQTGISAFMVDYRLAPEHNGTSLVDDCYDGLLWLHAHADALGIDRARIAVSGESAGGGLALGVALKARDENLSPPLAKIIVVYPMIDDRNTKPNPQLDDLANWKIASNVQAWNALLGEGHESRHDVSPHAAPARAASYAGLPEMYLETGNLDIFVHEDLELARRMIHENIQVELHVLPGFPHVWELFGGDKTDVGKLALQSRLRAYTTF
ncbi:uncharacterized protein PFL1_05453 [Pseudozyma flocculosa PF-1]|uniref:Related to arylesterase/monoxygenase n=2 Tax=Pseudozyma flocculosa TaxID=84751 RepID=A0A5C3FCF1_9BASI|nr:uncharacterized protein PFL1_05453 [Pseudozyma flocculosa PF-1]EPQ26818.1 hypothetical protein PFL1_05453 [Pseudozyma flocculosa PF-1]SPO42113.1 related to arylesterase/monoxygenase [Pseudozyma flocculosa]